MTNLLSPESSSFEGGSTGAWIIPGGLASGTLVNVAGNAYDGERVLKATAAVASINVQSPMVGVVGDQLYGWTVAIRPAAVVLPGITANIYWYDAAGTYLSNVAVFADEVADEWVVISGSATSPEDGSANLVIWLYGVSPGESHYIDGAVLERVGVPPPSLKPPCVRKAWLTNRGVTVALEDVEGGWLCNQIDLGWPEVREVNNNKPDQDGVDDLTRYFGSRAITADIATTASAERPDAIASQFARFMHPGTRSQLHYVLDRGDNAERVLVVRPSGYQWPITGGRRREIALSFIAADPIARAAQVTNVAAWAGSSTSPGRAYPLTYDRDYPAGGGAGIAGAPSSPGDVATSPLLRVYGPITAPVVEWWSHLEGVETAYYELAFEPGFVIVAGEYVEIDCRNHAAYRNGDRRQSCIDALVWGSSGWPEVAVLPETNRLTLLGQSTDHITQVQAIWRDGYLT